jgi:two-component system, NtrC family, sensor kinase
MSCPDWGKAMKRRTKAGGKGGKSVRRKSTMLEHHRTPSKTLPDRRSATNTQETEIARLTRERDEALERERATGEVLRVVSSSPGDLEPVFEAMLSNAARLCQAHFGTMTLYKDSAFQICAMHNMPPIFAERFEREPIVRAGPLAPVSRAASTKDAVHVVDHSGRGLQTARSGCRRIG